MKQIETKIIIEEHQNFSTLTAIEIKLLEAAKKVSKLAYAPYSKYNVGCAILLDDGTIVLGNNQENAAYPSGICAERTAIYYKGANFSDKKIVLMAISANTEAFEVCTPVYPCGACRQAISEYEIVQQQAIPIIMQGASGVIHKSKTILDLLPFSFNPNNLKQ